MMLRMMRNEDDEVEDEDLEDDEDDDHDEHHACHSPALHHTPICAVERNQYRLEAISRKGKRFCRNIGLGISGGECVESIQKSGYLEEEWKERRREGGRVPFWKCIHSP